jgi:hypothetical protein
MNAVHDVRRVPRLSTRAFLEEHARSTTPVVFTGLFEGEPIASITDEAAVRACLGGLAVKTRLNYVSGFMRTAGAPVESGATMDQALSEYLDHAAAYPQTRRCCVEFTTPPEVRALFQVPALCRELAVLPDDLISLLFVANRGNSAHMHFDCDHRQVLLHQVMGVKRVIIVRPGVGRKVLPFGSLSSLMIEEMPEHEKARLFAYLGAYEVRLAPGETLYMPPLVWHYVEYTDTGMSFSLRFGRREIDRLLAEHTFHDVSVQNVGAALCRGPVDEAVESRIRAAVERAYPSPEERYACLKRFFEELVPELCPDAFAGRFSAAPFDRLEEKLGVDFYTSPEQVANGSADAWRR